MSSADTGATKAKKQKVDDTEDTEKTGEVMPKTGKGKGKEKIGKGKKEKTWYVPLPHPILILPTAQLFRKKSSAM